ncbi:MAG: penicillin-binding protein 2 [Eubacterium sp.]|nr:penicillin-binding protein 2 [Eubacterium sp.]
MKKKKKVFLRRMRRTLFFIMLGITAALIFLGGTLIYINLSKGAKYEKEVLSQKNYESITVPYRRGDILDANGTVLATSNKVYNLIIEPKNILRKEEYKTATVDALSKFFDIPKEKLEGYLENKNSLYTVVKKGISYEEKKAFEDFQDSDEGDDVIGVWFEENYIRIYPYDELCCHLLGFVVSGNEGLGGLEGSYNDELNGSNGRTYAYLNDGYNLVKTTEPATNGYNLVTSIDLEVQKIVQKNVEELQKTLNAKNVSVLVMRPKTCEVLALYNYHQYDPNDAYNLDNVKYLYTDERWKDNGFETVKAEEYAAFEDKLESEEELENEKLKALNYLWRSFIISDTFEPGSTYKTFVLSGALENGIVSKDDTFYCDGHQKVADYDMYCSKHDGHGTQDIPTSMYNSCNDAFMQIGAMMGRDIFSGNQSLFGFGQRTNVDILGEMDNESLSYLVYNREGLNEVELACSAYGQGVSVTMLQLCTAFCSVINGGYYYQPHVVRRVEDEKGNLITNYENILVRRTVSEQTSAEMREILQGVVEHGTGWRTQMEGYTTGGKTGTAEKLPRNNGKFILSFIGFAPVEDPEVVIYTLVDEPGVAEQDKSSGATILWANIAKDLFPYLNIYRTGDGEVAKEGVDENVSPVFVEGTPTDDATVRKPEDLQGGGETTPDGQDPAADGQNPEADGQNPEANGQDPAADGQNPAADGQNPEGQEGEESPGDNADEPPQGNQENDPADAPGEGT